jgi:hypothetical protein
MEYEFGVTPMGKPRMTQRDKWLNPPRVPITKYRLVKQGIEAYALMHKFVLTLKNNYFLLNVFDFISKFSVLITQFLVLTE